MATISKYKKRNGELSYQATVRVKQRGKVIFSATRSFPKESLAKEWAKRTEVAAAAPGFIEQHRLENITVCALLQRYRDELNAAQKLGRSKGYVIDLLLRSSIAELTVSELTSEEILDHCKTRRDGGAGPSTVIQDVSCLRTMLDHAQRIWKLPVTTKEVDAALPTLHDRGYVSKSRRRERRPTSQELGSLLEWLSARQARANASIPHHDIVKFAIASCMRLGEIGRIHWLDVDAERRCILVRERKDPSNKYTNDQWVPLLGEAWDIVQRQPRTAERIFPFNMDSVGAAFERGCAALGIHDLRFHDLRHHGVSLLFEQGLHIQEVAMVSGHKSWNNLKRYTQLKPESLHARIAAPEQTRSAVAAVAISVAGCLFMGPWKKVDDIAAAYDLDATDLVDAQLLFAGDFGASGAVVVFVDAAQMFGVFNDSATRIWMPEATTANRLRHKVTTGKIGRDVEGGNLYGKQLIEVLAKE